MTPTPSGPEYKVAHPLKEEEHREGTPPSPGITHFPPFHSISHLNKTWVSSNKFHTIATSLRCINVIRSPF
jgi:hypothetical protein